MQPFFAFLLGWFTLLGSCLGLAVLPFAKKQVSCDGQYIPVLPLFTLCCGVLLLLGFSFADLLRPGVFLITGLGLAGWVLTVTVFLRSDKAHRQQSVAVLARPGWLVTFGGSPVLAFILAVRQPLFTQWDEFSFWGLAAKTVWQNDALYTLVQNTNLAARSYPPALSLLSYLFCFTAKQFAPWAVFAAYGVFIFAVFGTVVGCFPKHNALCIATCTVFLAVCPFAVEYHIVGQQLTSYVSAYADAMLGLAAAGGVAVWLSVRPAGQSVSVKSTGLKAALAVCPVIAFLVCIKDVGLPLALVVALICTTDAFLCRSRQKGCIGSVVAVAALQLGSALAAYLTWSVHLAYALNQDRSQTGGSAGLSTFGMVSQGLKELCGIGRSDKFSAILSGMVNAFLHRRVTVFGSGLFTCAVIFLLIFLAFLLLPTGRKRRAVGFGLCTAFGYIGYTFFQLICYVYVFSDSDGRGLVSYERYMSSYTLFWLVGSVCLVALSCQDKLTDGSAARAKKQLTVSGCFVVLLCLTATRLCGCSLQLTEGQAADAYQQRIERNARQALVLTDCTENKKVDPDEKIWLISQWDDGGRWYRYAYALEGLTLYKPHGSGTVLYSADETADGLVLPNDSFTDFIRQNGITLVLIDVVDYDIMKQSADWFSDGLVGAEQGICSLYRVTETPQGVKLVKVEVTD